jgi:hypothetical protein
MSSKLFLKICLPRAVGARRLKVAFERAASPHARHARSSIEKANLPAQHLHGKNQHLKASSHFREYGLHHRLMDRVRKLLSLLVLQSAQSGKFHNLFEE